ncbi:hypothetical protein [Clostridium hydrogenum]|nr:hypothetical protein [Clostridium hydrogenum]
MLITIILILIFIIVMFTISCIKAAARADEWEEEIERKKSIKKFKINK